MLVSEEMAEVGWHRWRKKSVVRSFRRPMIPSTSVDSCSRVLFVVSFYSLAYVYIIIGVRAREREWNVGDVLFSTACW